MLWNRDAVATTMLSCGTYCHPVFVSLESMEAPPTHREVTGLFTQRTTKRTLVGTLTASILLHAVVFGTLRFRNDTVESAPAPTTVLRVLEIEEHPNEPQEPGATESPGPPDDAEIQRAASPVEVPSQAPVAVQLADLKAGMRPVTALKTAALAMDEHQIRFDHPSAADTILAAPYPFAQLGGVRVGVGMGGGNCPAPATFP